MQMTASFAADLQRHTPIEALTGETPDISQYLDFGIYDRVWFKEDAGLGKTAKGRFLGVSHHVGSLMSYWILPASGIPVSQTTVKRITNLGAQTDQCKKRFEVYNRLVAESYNETYVEVEYLDQHVKPDISKWKELEGNDNVFQE